ncbi:MAG: DUF4124 domain-containing protein [Hydrogenophaga sp.]
MLPLNRLSIASRAGALSALLCVLAVAPLAVAQNTGGIYTCVDARGRTITSDRPIPACIDREQRELNKAGIVKRVVPPSYTAEEQATIDAKRKVVEAEQARINEERRRDRALLLRYPNQTVHDKERGDAIALIEDVILAVNKRNRTLAEQRKEIDTELEFYQSDASKAPAWLKRRIDDNAEQMKVQQRFLADQALGKQRVNSRFDEELAKLRKLWAQ